MLRTWGEPRAAAHLLLLPKRRDVPVKQEQRVQILGRRFEVVGPPPAHLESQVVVEIVDLEAFRLAKRQLEGVLVIRLVVEPLRGGDQRPLARSEAPWTAPPPAIGPALRRPPRSDRWSRPRPGDGSGALAPPPRSRPRRAGCRRSRDGLREPVRRARARTPETVRAPPLPESALRATRSFVPDPSWNPSWQPVEIPAGR